MSTVSVVMAAYNGQRFLRAQIDSVTRQLLPGDELVVVDDASTDDTLALLRGIPSPFLKIHANPVNLGVRCTFERGLRLASQDFVFLCDQDDVWKPGKRAAFVAAFEGDPAVTLVVSDAEVIDADGRVTTESMMATRKGFDGTLLGTLVRNRYLGCAMALRRTVLEAALPIPASVPMHDMWLGLIAHGVGRVAYLPEPYLQYRRHDANLSPLRRQSWPRMLKWRVTLLAVVVGRLGMLVLRKRRLRADAVRRPARDEGNR